MSTTYDLWLWLMLLPVALVIVFLLAGRAPPELVSSTLLWRGLDEPPRRSGRRRLLPPELLSLSISILLLVVLALSAAAPWFVSRPPANAFAVVVDASSSMAARDHPGAPPRLELARRRAVELLGAERASPERTLVISGDSPMTVRTGPGEDAPFERALRSMRASRSDEDRLFELLNAAAARVSAAGGGRVALVSDFAGPASMPRHRVVAGVAVETHVVGSTVANRAVESVHVAFREATPGAVDLFSTFVNASNEPARTQLVAAIDGRELQRWPVRLAAGERRSSVFGIPRAQSGGLLTLSIADGGVADHDDQRQRRIRPAAISVARLGLPLPASVAAAVDAVAGAFSGGTSQGVRVTLLHGVPPGDLSGPWIYVPAPRGNAPGTDAPRIVVEWSRRGADLVDPAMVLFVDPADMPPEQPVDRMIPVAFAGGAPVLAVIDDGAERGVWCGLPLDRLVPSGDASLPLLVASLLDWLASGEGETISPARAVHADLASHPPPGAHVVTAETDMADSKPVPLRGALLWTAAFLLLGEATRRLWFLRVRLGALSVGPARSVSSPNASGSRR